MVESSSRAARIVGTCWFGTCQAMYTIGSCACFLTITRRSPFWAGSTASIGGGTLPRGIRPKRRLIFSSASAARNAPTATIIALFGT